MSETPPPPSVQSSPPSAPPPSEPKSPPSAAPSAPGTGVPPSRPPGLPGDPLLGGGVDRVARLQTIAAVVLGLALIAIPLYLWRRPRSESQPVTSLTDASAPLVDAGLVGAAPAALAGPAVTLSDPKVMECHDTGPRHTRPEDCDHLAAVEKGFAAAIESAGSCVPTTSGGGTLVYVLDASFGRKRHPLELMVPRDGRSLKSPHGEAAAVTACMAAVKRGLDGVVLEGVPHGHSRYKVAITTTYAAATAANAPP